MPAVFSTFQLFNFSTFNLVKTIEKYVFKSFLTSFALAFLVLSFVLTIGLMVQIVSFILDGVSIAFVWDFASVCLPETMQWTIPLALLVSSVLVFSRLSADSEIAAMRACGVNLVSVMKWPMMFGFACALFGAWINNEIVPREHEVRRSLKSKVSVDTGLELLEPGLWIDDFPKVKLYFGAKEGNWLRDLVVFDYSDSRIERTITAAKALVESEGRDINLDLYNMTVDPIDAEHPGMARIARYQYTVKDALADTKYTKKGKDMRFRELVEKLEETKNLNERAIAHAEKDGEVAPDEVKKIKRNLKRARSKLKVELSKRFVFAAASFCFIMIGVPLGIRAQRKESTIGMAISLAVAIGYYLLVMLMISLQMSYAIHPEILIWTPVALTLALAAKFISKNR